MCGIAGIFSNQIDENQTNLLNKINNCLCHRGPDSSGSIAETHIIFGHNRLAIQDLSKNGFQPMKSASGRYVITYNGEIYNHLKIRNEYFPSLSWKGLSDTETLIELIEKFGLENSLKLIDGMYAFALWDKKEKKLSIVRDKFGEKPIYFGIHDNKFIFASELKAFEIFRKDLFIDLNSVKKYLNLSYIPSPYTIYQNIYKLKHGHFLTIDKNIFQNSSKNGFDNNKFVQKKYWSQFDSTLSVNKKSYNSYRSEIKDSLEKSVKDKMISDVPIGVFLSGGIDSSLLTSIASKYSNKKLDTFTISSESINFDESERAQEISKYLNTQHHTINVSKDDQINVIQDLNKIYDEPFADSSQIPSIILSKYTKNFVKVALTGDGADEIFYGYNRYIHSKKIWKKIKFLPKPIKKIISYLLYSTSPSKWILIQNLINNFKNSKSNFELLDEKMYKIADSLNNSNSILDHYKSHLMIWQKNEKIFLDEDNAKVDVVKFDKFNINEDNFDYKINLLDIESYLPDDILVKTDRSSMKFGLETRAPYLSSKLLDITKMMPQTFKSSNHKGKLILRDLLRDYLPKKFSEGPKKGFSIPMNDWLNGSLREWSEDLFNSNIYKKNTIINNDLVNRYWADHKSLKINYHKRIWNILILMDWLSKKGFSI